MRAVNYCFDTCHLNTVPRSSYDVNGEAVTVASSGMNQKLSCMAGYKQTVNSYQAMLNSESNGTRVCHILRKKLTE